MNSEIGVKLSYGVHEMMAAAVGNTIAQVRDAYSQVLNLPAEAVAVVRGKKVSPDYTIKQGDEVEFIKEAGVKGSPDWRPGGDPWIREHWLLLVLIGLVAVLAGAR